MTHCHKSDEHCVVGSRERKRDTDHEWILREGRKCCRFCAVHKPDPPDPNPNANGVRKKHGCHFFVNPPRKRAMVQL